MKWWWIKLARYALPQAGGLAAIFALLVVSVGLGLFNPWPLKLIADNVLAGEPLPLSVGWLASLPGAGSPHGLLAWLAAATVALFFARRITAIAQSYLQAGAGSRMVYDLATDVFAHLQQRSVLFHQRQPTGDLVRRVTADTSCVRELIMNVYLPLLTSLVTVVSMFAIMWQLSPPLAFFALVLAIPLGLIIRYFAGPMTDRKYKEWELQGEMSALLEQTLTAIPLVQAFGREPREDERFRDVARRTIDATYRSEVAQHQFRVGTGAVTAAATAIVTVLGGWAVLEGTLSVGSLLVLLAYFTALYSPIETLAYLSEGFASAGAGARRILEITESDDHGAKDLPGAKPLPEGLREAGISVRFEGVSFGYEPEPGRPVLHDVSLTARPGEVVALVGATGAGKSTLCSLIPRLFDPWSGTVYFNDTDARQFQLASLRKHVAIVLQEPFLLPLSIADNIAYGRPEASREEIVAAAVGACADPFIERLPKGYDTVIGERGVTLSGGEKQRLSIARALLQDAPIMILDEPTAALDAATESQLVQALEQLMHGRTTFVIAHRLSTIRRANQIIVLEEGRCIESGTHDELLSKAGAYRSFQVANVSSAQQPMGLSEIDN
jgi:ATP-binding cassette subfamily B protein/subfamily B ATP-binding cassette protein MsbA